MTNSRLSFVIVLLPLLASCGTSASIDEASSVPISMSPSLPATESSPPEPEIAPQQDFLNIIAGSCETALNLGVEEVSEDSSFAYYLFPEELAIDGYSAVEYRLVNDAVSLVWETDVFYVCYFANQIALADEFGAAASISFTAAQDGFKLVDKSFSDELSYQVSVSDGLITGVYDGSTQWIIRYGIDEEKVYLLTRAVEEFFE